MEGNATLAISRICNELLGQRYQNCDYNDSGTEMYLRGTAINLKVIGLEISIFSPQCLKPESAHPLMDLLNCLGLCSLGVGIGKCSEILSVFFPLLLTHVCRLMDLITGSCNCSTHIKTSKSLLPLRIHRN